MICAGDVLAALKAMELVELPEIAPEMISADEAPPVVPSTVHVCGAPRVIGAERVIVPLAGPRLIPSVEETGAKVNEL